MMKNIIKKICLIFGILISIVILYVLVNIFGNELHWSAQGGIRDYQAVQLDFPVKSIAEGEKVALAKASKLMKNAKLSSVHLGFDSVEDLKNSLGRVSYSYIAENEYFFGPDEFRCFITIDISKQAITSFEAFGGGDDLPREEPLDRSMWKIDIDDLYTIISQKAPDYIKNKKPSSTILVRAGNTIWRVLDVPPSEAGSYAEEKIITINPTEDVE